MSATRDLDLDAQTRAWWAAAEVECPAEFAALRHQLGRVFRGAAPGKGIIDGQRRARARLLLAMARKGLPYPS